MKIAFIGGGNMGEAMIAALLEKKICKTGDITVSDISGTRLDYLEQRYKVAVTNNTIEAAMEKDVIVLAVKPQNFKDVFESLKGKLQPNQLILSIAAGVTIKTITRGLWHERVARAMPNMPAQIGLGISGWTVTPQVNKEQKAMARKILESLGKEIFFAEEEYLDKVTAVSGSGPAYFFLFAEALTDGAIALGLERRDAEALVLQTMIGAAHLLEKSDKPAAELRKNVTSKGGTTEKALEVFMKNNFVGIVEKAVKAACDRAKELGNG
jgi:pyrroline-5-carboxylate reductase